MTIRFDPIGECIYCRTKEPPLYREHIIPFGLGGDMILPEASCKACAAITGKIEQFMLKSWFGPMRYVNNFRTRRPKDRPTQLPLSIKAAEGESREYWVPISEYPTTVAFPVLPPARALRGLPDENVPVEGGRILFWHQRSRLEALLRKLGIESGTFVAAEKANFSKFAQMLAKIGHSFAVARMGIDGFQHVATDLILGRSESINYLVGCGLDDIPPAATEGMHYLQTAAHQEAGIIVTEVRLFASLGMPVYHVVVGLLEGGEIQAVEPPSSRASSKANS